MEGGMAFENLLIGLVLIGLCLFLLDLFGAACLGLEDIAADFCSPLLNCLETQQGRVTAILDLGFVDRQVVLKDV